MTLSKIDKRWIVLSHFPGIFTECDHCISPLDNHEFLVAAYLDHGDEDEDIHKYNIHKDEWTYIIKNRGNEFKKIDTMAIGQQIPKTKIYLGHSSNKKLFMFDIETQKLSIIIMVSIKTRQWSM